MSKTMDIGFAIKKFRENKGLTQEELADELKITQSRLSKIENGRIQKIDIELLLQISQILSVDISEFIPQEGS